MARRRALAAVGLVAAFLAIGAQLTGALGRVEAWTVDARFALRGAQPARDIAVVSIGDGDISFYGRWPMRRSLHARAIDALRRAGARVVAYHVQLTPARGDHGAHLALYDAIARTPGTVLATTTVRADGD